MQITGFDETLASPHPAPALLTQEQVPVPTGSALKKFRSIAVGLALTDSICILAALFGSYRIRFGTELGPAYLVAVFAAPLIWIAVFRTFGLYSPQHLSAVEEFRRVISASTVGVVFLVTMSYWTKSEFSRIWMAIALVTAVSLELATRRIWRMHVGRLRRRGDLQLRTLVIGTNDEAERLVVSFSRDPSLGFNTLGYALSSDGQMRANRIRPLTRIDGLVSSIREHKIECLFVASSAVTPEDMLWVSQAARQEGIEVKISANTPQILTSRVSVQQLGDVMALSIRPVKLTGTQAILKRAFDIVVTSIALLIASPLMAVVAVAIKSDSKGPVVFAQERVTKGRRRFKAYKFRTMTTNSDDFLTEHGIDPSVAFFKLGRDDPRVTRVGRFLRTTSLDELPQLWNVLKGEMTLVGPRPLPANQIEANLELLGPRLEVQGGLTGWWQVNGRSEVSPEEAVKMDTFYIENWSLTLDLFVLLKTVGVLLKRKGAV